MFAIPFPTHITGHFFAFMLKTHSASFPGQLLLWAIQSSQTTTSEVLIASLKQQIFFQPKYIRWAHSDKAWLACLHLQRCSGLRSVQLQNCRQCIAHSRTQALHHMVIPVSVRATGIAFYYTEQAYCNLPSLRRQQVVRTCADVYG